MRVFRKSSPMTAIASLVTLTAFGACTNAPPTIDTGAEAERTFDGLYPVRNTRADEAWARPGIDLSRYSKILLQEVGIEYRPGGEAGRTWAARSRGGPFEVTERQKERLREIVREEFMEELRNSSRYGIVDEPGPDVLLVRGALLDVVSYVPPEPVGARTEVFLSKVGEATLVIELRDSITETILARAVDRRAAEPAGLILVESNRVTNAAEVRRLARSWARSLRQRLDEFGSPPR